MCVQSSIARRAPLTRLHGALWTAAATLLAPAWLAALSAVPRLRLPLRQRLGALPPALANAPAQAPRVLFHAASAGDVRAVAPVVRALAARCPLLVIACTVQTRSGLEMAQRLDLPMTISALPLEGAPWVDRFVTALRPDVLVLEYLELWPRLVGAATRHGARIALQNGRVHPRRMARYTGPGGRLLRAILADLALCTARSPGDAERLSRLGAPHVRAHPHTKHALLEAPSRTALDALLDGRALHPPRRERTWIAGSLHADEFALVLDAQARLCANASEPPRLLLCPRYVELGARAAQLARARGLSVCRIGPGERASGPADATVVVLETTGELATWYGWAGAALVGGTLGARGGQNPLEAAVAGCQVVVGPATEQIEAELAWLDTVVRLPDTAPDTLAGAIATALARTHSAPRTTLPAVEAASAAANAIADEILAMLETRRGRSS